MAAGTVEEYLAALPEARRAVAESVLAAAHRGAPGAGERISYGMPTLSLDGQSVVHIGAWSRHIGLYPLPAVDGELARELAPYDTGKGTASFPLSAAMPLELIERVVAALVAERERAPG